MSSMIYVPYLNENTLCLSVCLLPVEATTRKKHAPQIRAKSPIEHLRKSNRGQYEENSGTNSRSILAEKRLKKGGFRRSSHQGKRLPTIEALRQEEPRRGV